MPQRRLDVDLDQFGDSGFECNNCELRISDNVQGGIERAGIIEIYIETANAAFDENQGGEVARILRKLANAFDTLQDIPQDLAHPLHDLNGNKTGTVNAS